MAKNSNKILREGYDRLKKTFEKMLKAKKEQPQPQFVLQPIRNQKYLRGTGQL